MSGKTKTQKKSQTKLLSMVCKQASFMRARFRMPPPMTSRISQKAKKSLSNNKNKENFQLIVRKNEEKSDENKPINSTDIHH